MAIPALKFELEEPVEERVAKLETHIEHIRTDVGEMKGDIRRLNDKVDALDQKLTDKIDGLDQRLADKIDGLKEAFAELKIGRALDRVWWLLMCGALLGVMARGFKWI
jgi:uncharacterized coiled-coil protein SlyX